VNRNSITAFALLTALALPGCGTAMFIDDMPTGSVTPVAASAEPKGEVYIFRGVGGRFATLDLDRLGEKISQQGVSAKVYEFMQWRTPAEEAVKRYRGQVKPAPIILLGHSAGADAAISFAEKLKEERIPVSLLITLDPTRLPHDVPANVDRFLNIYASMNFFGGGNVRSGGEYQGHFASIDLKNYWEVPHVRMLRIGALDERLVAKIIRVATAPTNLEGVTVPIRYVMPRGMKVELWDSGVPVKAEQNDSATKIAARYGVPAWAVASINEVEETAPLTPGQRIVIPRDLDAPPPAAPPAIGGPLTSFAPRGR
jgi:hypothetical protein